MKTSESLKEFAVAMNKAQAEMTAAKKDSANPFFKSKYADLGSVILALKEAFADNGLSYIQAPVMAENSVGVVTRILHVSGEWMEETLTLPMVKLDPQAAGSAITYARRYALQSMAGIPSADDDGEFAMQRNLNPYTEDQKALFDSMIAERDSMGFVAWFSQLSDDARGALANSFEAGAKSSGKQAIREMDKEGFEKWQGVVLDIDAMIEGGDAHGLLEAAGELERYEKAYLAKKLGDQKAQQMGKLIKEARQ